MYSPVKNSNAPFFVQKFQQQCSVIKGRPIEMSNIWNVTIINLILLCPVPSATVKSPTTWYTQHHHFRAPRKSIFYKSICFLKFNHRQNCLPRGSNDGWIEKIYKKQAGVIKYTNLWKFCHDVLIRPSMVLSRFNNHVYLFSTLINKPLHWKLQYNSHIL